MGLRGALKQGFYGLQRQAGRMYVGLHSRPDREHVAIFGLHTIADARSDMAVPAGRFREQLQALLDSGYKAFSLSELLTSSTRKEPLPQPGFAITFDDGYESVYRTALPILEELQIPFTLALTVGFLDGKIAPPWHSSHPTLVEEYRRESAAFRPMSWEQARDIAAHPLARIGSHTINHFCLALIPPEKLKEEVRDSRNILEQKLGVAVDAFAYPYGVARHGAYSASTEALLRECGYAASFTSEIGRFRPGAGPYLMPRITLTAEDTAIDARSKAAGGYDWVAVAQSTFQKVFPNPHM